MLTTWEIKSLRHGLVFVHSGGLYAYYQTVDALLRFVELADYNESIHIRKG